MLDDDVVKYGTERGGDNYCWSRNHLCALVIPQYGGKNPLTRLPFNRDWLEDACPNIQPEYLLYNECEAMASHARRLFNENGGGFFSAMLLPSLLAIDSLMYVIRQIIYTDPRIDEHGRLMHPLTGGVKKKPYQKRLKKTRRMRTKRKKTGRNSK